MTAVVLREVTKVYGNGVHALNGVTIDLPAGRLTAVMGPSGCGKSTLMQCAAGLDTPTSGTVTIGGAEISRLSEAGRTALRRERIGFVFQSYNLLPALDLRDNITLPLRLAGRRADPDRLERLAARVGLRDRLGHRPAELSGGQQQRAAIVRALIAGPDVVFADEPTGALDLRSAAEVLDLLRELVDELGQTVLMVTHDPNAAARADQALVMADGRVVDVIDAPRPDDLAHHLTLLGSH